MKFSGLDQNHQTTEISSKKNSCRLKMCFTPEMISGFVVLDSSDSSRPAMAASVKGNDYFVMPPGTNLVASDITIGATGEQGISCFVDQDGFIRITSKQGFYMIFAYSYLLCNDMETVQVTPLRRTLASSP